MTASARLLGDSTAGPPASATAAEPRERAAKVALVEAHVDGVWRFLRRLGLTSEDADDAAQEVFIVAMRRWEAIHPGQEKRFLFGIALRIASSRRRSARVLASRSAAVDVETMQSHELAADEVLRRREAIELLDRALGELPDEVRSVFVLYELEEMTMQEIANVTGQPLGTVGSRLRRARELFEKSTKRMTRTRQP